MRGILRFLQQCHAKGIVYRDVKPANFLFLTRRPDSPLKASDLGLAVRWRPSQPRLRAKSGTVVYMAPEVLLRVSEGVTVWRVCMAPEVPLRVHTHSPE